MKKSETAFVTGSDGFIGSHLVEALIRAGTKVRALTYYNSFGSNGWLDTLSPDVFSEIEVVPGDVRDPQHMERLVKGCDVVFHLAALIGIPFSYVAPDLYIQTNVNGTLNILNAAHKSGHCRIIHTSTSEVYGTAQFVPITEEHPLNPQSPYAASKASADHLALSFYRSFELPVTVVRPFNTFGPRQSTRAIIPTLITQMQRKSPTIKVGSLTPKRDFTFVKDTAAGFIAASHASKAQGQVVQLGSNFEVSMADVVEDLAKIFGTTPKIETEEARIRPEKSEVHRLWAANKKAKDLLGWEPEHLGRAGFTKALRATVEWFAAPQNLAHYRNLGYGV